MSLINDALKKAQKMRSHDEGGVMHHPVGPGSRQEPSRRSSLATHWILLIVAGAAVLVSVSVIATVYFLRKPLSSISIKSEDRVTQASEPAASSPTVKTDAATPDKSATPLLIVPPQQGASTKPVATASAKERIASPVTTAPKPSTVPAAPVATLSQPAPAPVSPAPDLTKPNPKTQLFVDTVKVTGIRASGGESKVLMNDRVYRINNIVDRSTGLRLIEASTERLVFVDENGIRYVRNF